MPRFSPATYRGTLTRQVTRFTQTGQEVWVGLGAWKRKGSQTMILGVLALCVTGLLITWSLFD